MISKTSMTSTSGVVLMSDRGVSAPPTSPTFIAIRFYPLKNILRRNGRKDSAFSEIRGRYSHFPEHYAAGKWPWLAPYFFTAGFAAGAAAGFAGATPLTGADGLTAPSEEM